MPLDRVRSLITPTGSVTSAVIETISDFGVVGYNIDDVERINLDCNVGVIRTTGNATDPRHLITKGEVEAKIGESSYFVVSVNDHQLWGGSSNLILSHITNMKLPLEPALLVSITLYPVSTGWNANPLTVENNGKKINGVDENLVIDIDDIVIRLIFIDDDTGWLVYREGYRGV